MRRRSLAGLAALALSGLLFAQPSPAQQLSTTIDLNYTYEQEHADRDVTASTTYNQKYEIKYETSLTSAHDFLGAVRLELEDQWHTSEANTSRVAPTLEVQTKSSLLAARVVYEAVVATTDAFEESGRVAEYANSLTGELLMTPEIWPELKLKLQRQRDFELQSTDRTTDAMDFSLIKDLSALRLELNLKSEETDELLPGLQTSRSDEWTGKATYKEVLYGETEFEIAYETRQRYEEERLHAVFTGSTEESVRQIKSRAKNSLAMTPGLKVGLSWEYQFEQDLLVLDFDHKINNKYGLDLRWDLVDWFKVSAEAKRQTDLAVNDVGEDDERKVTDTLKGAVDLAPVTWLRMAAKAELTYEQAIAADTGGSVDRADDEKYEVVLKNKFGDFWDLTLNGTSAYVYEDGFLTNRESKLKGDLRLKYADFGVQPTYEVSRSADWDPGIAEPTLQNQTREAKIKLDYKLKVMDLVALSFAHEYGVKTENELDEVLNFERTLQFNESTRINLVITELVRDLRLEGEIDRKASDTQADTDPELIEVSYALKLDWKLENLSLASSFKYNDKGDTFDDLSFTTKLGWKGERLDVSGEYQFDKIFAEVTDEVRKLNLKLNYKF